MQITYSLIYHIRQGSLFSTVSSAFADFFFPLSFKGFFHCQDMQWTVVCFIMQSLKASLFSLPWPQIYIQFNNRQAGRFSVLQDQSGRYMLHCKHKTWWVLVPNFYPPWEEELMWLTWACAKHLMVPHITTLSLNWRHINLVDGWLSS